MREGINAINDKTSDHNLNKHHGCQILMKEKLSLKMTLQICAILSQANQHDEALDLAIKAEESST